MELNPTKIAEYEADLLTFQKDFSEFFTGPVFSDYWMENFWAPIEDMGMELFNATYGDGEAVANNSMTMLDTFLDVIEEDKESDIDKLVFQFILDVLPIFHLWLTQGSLLFGEKNLKA